MNDKREILTKLVCESEVMKLIFTLSDCEDTSDWIIEHSSELQDSMRNEKDVEALEQYRASKS